MVIIDSLRKMLECKVIWLAKNKQERLQFLSSETDLLQYYLQSQLYLKDDILYSVNEEENHWNIVMGNFKNNNNKGLKDPGFMFGLREQQIQSFASASIKKDNAVYLLRFFSENKLSELNSSIFNNAFAIKHFFNTQINHINNIDLVNSVKFSLNPLNISH